LTDYNDFGDDDDHFVMMVIGDKDHFPVEHKVKTNYYGVEIWTSF